MIVAKAIPLVRTQNTPLMLLKLDIIKAYDTMEWYYILAVLKCKGFSFMALRWMRAILKTTNFSIAINRRLYPTIFASRGGGGAEMDFWLDKWANPNHEPFSQRIQFWEIMELSTSKGLTKINDEIGHITLPAATTTTAQQERLRFISPSICFTSPDFYEYIYERINGPQALNYQVNWALIWRSKAQPRQNLIHRRLAHKGFLLAEVHRSWEVQGP
eukprot:Gb_25596 [translate_table: standard]